MTFVILYTVMLTFKGIIIINGERQNSECGIRPVTLKKHYRSDAKYRNGKIIEGQPTHEGQFPWQVSLELLHPSIGFLGHWCGAVLIDQYWVLSAAHCIDNDLFNLPLPPLWTVVLGEFNRDIESGYEQRIPVDRIVMHQDYKNFQHDLAMIKLSQPANMGVDTIVRKICLPFIAFNYPQSWTDVNGPIIHNNNNNNYNNHDNGNNDDGDKIPNRENNWLRVLRHQLFINRTNTLKTRTHRLSYRRRNDKFLHDKLITDDVNPNNNNGHRHHDNIDDLVEDMGDDLLIHRYQPTHLQPELPYIDCIATGWGKSTTSGELMDILLQTHVPIHKNSKCADAYGSNVKIHRGHLCAGKLNGKGGTCVGDSGGPLQCRLTENGPWLLAGVTSFGSGCAKQGYPDVYSRISYYIKWITKIMADDL